MYLVSFISQRYSLHKLYPHLPFMHVIPSSFPSGMPLIEFPTMYPVLKLQTDISFTPN